MNYLVQANWLLCRLSMLSLWTMLYHVRCSEIKVIFSIKDTLRSIIKENVMSQGHWGACYLAWCINCSIKWIRVYDATQIRYVECDFQFKILMFKTFLRAIQLQKH